MVLWQLLVSDYRKDGVLVADLIFLFGFLCLYFSGTVGAVEGVSYQIEQFADLSLLILVLSRSILLLSTPHKRQKVKQKRATKGGAYDELLAMARFSLGL